jgi:GTP cyclohydrolase IA
VTTAAQLPEQLTPLGDRPQLRVVDPSPAMDLGRAERAVADLLDALGQDPTSEELAETPRRVAAGYAELLTPAPFTLTTFPNDEGYDELVLARAIPFARRMQLQERLTTQVADWLETELEPKGVGVVLEAEHLCMSLRGVRAAGARTVTSALHGRLRTDPRSRQEFLALAGATT